MAVRILRTETNYQASLMLADENLMKKIGTFPESSMGCVLIDVTLFDGRVVEQVPVAFGRQIYFYEGMPVFSEADIMSVAPSLV